MKTYKTTVEKPRLIINHNKDCIQIIPVYTSIKAKKRKKMITKEQFKNHVIESI